MPATAIASRGSSAPISRPKKSQPVSAYDHNWRASLFQPVQAAAKILGISTASVYRFEAEGRLRLRRLAGRTLVETASLVALAETAEPWTASTRSAQAVQARKERARAAWED